MRNLEVQFMTAKNSTISHPISAWIMDNDATKPIGGKVEFRDENQLRVYWLGFYTGQGCPRDMESNARLVEVEELPIWR